MPHTSLLLKNARVITMDPVTPEAGMVAVEGDTIVYIGSNDNAAAFTGADTRVIDCAGKTVIPGFIDAHCHTFALWRKLLHLDVGPGSARSVADIVTIIRRAAAQTPKGQWIQGTGYNEFYLAEKRHPNRWELDAATPDHPVMLTHRSLHACVLNSMALSLAGIDAATAERPGTMIEREVPSGEPNGLLHEMVGYVREKVIPPVSLDDKIRSASMANRQYLSQGITGLQDASYTNDLERWYTIRDMQEKGFFLPRIAMMAGYDNLQPFLDAGFAYGYGDNNLRFLGLKIIPSETKGELYPPQAELNRIVLDNYTRRIPVAIHAVSQEMVAAVITAFEQVRAILPGNNLILRIEHCSECPPELADRLSLLRPVIVTQPPFVYYNGDRYLKVLPADAHPWLYRFNTMIKTGTLVAAGSDTPVVPDNPLVGIYAAVTRQTSGGQILNSEERISVHQSLAMYTANAAAASGEANIKGSLTSGKLADMAVLSDDPFKVETEQIKDIKVAMTILGGKVVYET